MNISALAVIPYRVVIIPIKKLSNAMTTSNPWVCVSGELGDSGIMQIPKNVLEMTFDVSSVTFDLSGSSEQSVTGLGVCVPGMILICSPPLMHDNSTSVLFVFYIQKKSKFLFISRPFQDQLSEL